MPRIGWTLPYVATIVWPVQQKESEVLLVEDEGCIAYLTVDSKHRGVFKEQFDLYLGAGVADALFHPLSLFSDLTRLIEERH